MTPILVNGGTKKTGRVRDGEDFWSLVDAWFKDCVERWGDDLNVEEWKRWVIIISHN
jgi:hypothetical protein